MPSKSFATLEELADSFAARADTPAVVTFDAAGATTLSYRELDAEIHRGAAALAAAGIETGSIVAIWAPNSPAWITAYFAALLCGATVIPLDNQMTVERAGYILDHSGAALLLTATSHVAELERSEAPGRAPLALLDGDRSDPRYWQSRIASSEPPRAAADPERIASLLYTSGTTGTPKAVPLTHANLAANVTALLAADLIDAEDRVLIPLPFHHAYPFTVGLLTALATGARVILPAGVSGPEITRAASEAGATAMIAVPRLCTALWSAIESGVKSRGKLAQRLFALLLALSTRIKRATGLAIGKVLFRALHRRVGGRLRTLGCGGAQLDRALALKLEGLGWTVLTGYGLTETSPVLTFNQHRRRRLGSEGRALPGIELKIEPREDQPHGEILARGPSVFSGYWNNPEETGKAFDAEGWFRTGDLGWIDKRGFLHIAGRSKEVIVLPDGKNIFPDEIEEAYLGSALIKEIAILETDGALVALVVPEDERLRERGAHRVEELLKEEMAEIAMKLPPYQRVSDYRLTRAALPRTPLGKLKRHELSALYEQAAARSRAVAPAELDDADRALLESDRTRPVWEWLESRYPDHELGLDTSPQLELRIDSLEWVSLSIEIERNFHVSLSGEAISRIVTLRDLLREIERAPAAEQGGGAPTPLPALEEPGWLLRVSGSLLYLIDRLLVRSFFRLETIGADRLPAAGASFMIVPNHSSYLDPLAIAAALPRAHLANLFWAGWTGKMFAGPVSRFVSRATRVFPVEPDRDPTGAIGLGRAVLERAGTLVWFPEGRRSYTGALDRFQPGIGLLLEHGDVPAVPTALIGSYEAWPRNRRWPRPARVRVVFGVPLTRAQLVASGNGGSDAEKIADALHSAVAALLAEHGS